MLAAGLPRAHAARLGELEMLHRYPALWMAASVLFVLGLACDGWLLACWILRRKEGADRESLLRIPPKPWGLAELVLVTGGMILVLMTGTLFTGLLTHVVRLPEDSVTSLVLLGELSLRVFVLLGMAWFFQRRLVDLPHALGITATGRRRGAMFGVFAYLAILPPLTLVFAVYAQVARLLGRQPTLQPVAELLNTTRSGLVAVLIVLFAVVVAPLFEEVYFRGFAYPALKQRWGPGRALALVSALFALVHFHEPSLVPLFTLALGLGLSYELSGSLWAPITMHALFNMTNVATLLYLRFHA